MSEIERIARKFADRAGLSGFTKEDFICDLSAALASLSETAPDGEAKPVVGGCLTDVVAMSASVESKRVLQLHFNREVTDEDRVRLTRLHNAALASPIDKDAEIDRLMTRVAEFNYNGEGYSATGTEARLADLQRAPQGVTVKPLEWHKSHMPSWNDDWHTTTPFIYSVRCADENGWKWSAHGANGYAYSAEAAKAAAQADYETRILSALASPTQGEREPAVTEAREVAQRWATWIEDNSQGEEDEGGQLRSQFERDKATLFTALQGHQP